MLIRPVDNDNDGSISMMLHFKFGIFMILIPPSGLTKEARTRTSKKRSNNKKEEEEHFEF
jgi:hypothetical protein